MSRVGGFKRGFGRLINVHGAHEALEAALKEALGYGHGLNERELQAKTAKILPMFQTMPKNMQGRVGRDAMQYMVARYFGHEHGWSIKGFDPASTGGNSSVESSSVEILQQKL